MALVSNGAAFMILQKDCTAEAVMEKIRYLLENKSAYEAMQKALLDMSVPDSAQRLCTIMEELIAGKKRK